MPFFASTHAIAGCVGVSPLTVDSNHDDRQPTRDNHSLGSGTAFTQQQTDRQTDRALTMDIDNGFAIHSCSGLVRAVHNTTLRCCWAFLLDGSLSAVCRPAGTKKLQADLPRGQRKAHRPVAEARRRSERVLPAVAVCGMAVGGSTR